MGRLCRSTGAHFTKNKCKVFERSAFEILFSEKIVEFVQNYLILDADSLEFLMFRAFFVDQLPSSEPAPQD